MRPILIAVAVLFLSQSAQAEEVFGPDSVNDAVSADVSEADAFPVDAPVIAPEGITFTLPFYWDDLTDAGVSLLGIAWKALFTALGGWLLVKVVGSDRAKIVMDAVKVSVDYTWDDMGRELKHAAGDKKLDADERQKLRNKAREHTLSILTGAARKLFESYTISKVNSMVSSAVEKRKAIASVRKG